MEGPKRPMVYITHPFQGPAKIVGLHNSHFLEVAEIGGLHNSFTREERAGKTAQGKALKRGEWGDWFT